MNDNEVNQLAATLKAAGLCASLLDAKNMASSISDGVRIRHREVEERIIQHMGTGQRDGGFEVIKEKVGCERPKPNSFVAKKMAESEVFVNKDSVGLVIEQDEPISKLMQEEDDIETIEVEPEPVQSSLSIFDEPEKPDIVVDSSREQEVAEVEPQREEPGQEIEESPTQERTMEIPVDKSKPRATLTEQQKKDTDITKWFYFGNK